VVLVLVLALGLVCGTNLQEAPLRLRLGVGCIYTSGCRHKIQLSTSGDPISSLSKN